MRVRLTGGAYKARSIIASAQRQVNLFSEVGAGGAVFDGDTPAGNPMAGGVSGGLPVLYPTPGLTALGTPPTAGAARGLYWANSETLFYVCGNTLYNVSSSWGMTVVGTIGAATTPVSMADNGQTLVLVDGSAFGYQVTLSTLAFSAINGTPYPAGNAPTVASTSVYGFYGGDRVAMLDGFMIFNQPGTANWYSTYNNEIVFDSLYIAAKDGYADNVASVVVNQKSIWVIGERTTEIWYDAGNADFPFSSVPGLVQHGCIAKYSIAQADEAVLWLAQDQTGANIAVQTNGYTTTRISTHAIETKWGSYATTADAIGFTFQQAGHRFWQLNFPTADRSWRYDLATGEWHEAIWTDSNGAEHRHRAQCAAWAYGKNVCADWQTGALYAIDPTNFTDAGQPIQRRRDFPHFVNDGFRVFYQSMILDMSVGNSVGTSSNTLPLPFGFGTDFTSNFSSAGAASGFGSDFSSDFVSLTPIVPVDTSPQVLLRWSDDRGRTFNDAVGGSMGATGAYNTSVQFQRLGMGRDRVFSVTWNAPVDTALQGAWLAFTKSSS